MSVRLSSPRYSNIGVDTGGTFTDLVLIDELGGIRTEKSFSTPDAPATGIFDVLNRVATVLDTSVPDILSRTNIFAHGTTVSTNALITRRGARVGILFTAGFEDTLAIGRGPVGRVGGLPQSMAMDFIHTEPPAPLVPQNMIRGVAERIDAAGEVVVPIDMLATTAAVSDLVEAGAESLAVCLLWAFRNPEHEERVAEICADFAPEIPISLSHQIAPRIGEFERAVTTVVNAYVSPVTQKYISELQDGLSNDGLANPVQIMTSTGGAARVEDMDRQAVSVINSGPTAGLVAARFLGNQLGDEKIITADMGGTSFDVGLIDGNTLEEDPHPYLNQGLPISLPAVKLVTIGAGGGSIAWTDGYRLKVGPQSAGANPGPAAYDKGGVEPTVTDALLVCGIIDPDNFFGGSYTLNPDLSHKAIQDRIADPMGMSVDDAAAGILEIVNARMANLIRKVTIESGHDPAAFVLYAYGGATAAHCAEFARQLGIGKLVLPYAGPVFSALGVAISDIHYSHSRSEPVMLNSDAVSTVNRNFVHLRDLAISNIDTAGMERAGFNFRHRIELRYAGQMNEVTLDWPRGNMEQADIATLRGMFESLYGHRFGAGTTRTGTPIELISFRVEAVHPTQKPSLAEVKPAFTAPAAPRSRKIFIREKGHIDAEIFDFRFLAPATMISGPAVIERDTTTIWIPPGDSAEMDEYGNIIIGMEAHE